MSTSGMALDHDIVVRTRRIASEIVGPASERVDREAVWPEEGMGALLAGGLGGLVVPQASGGLGHGLTAVAEVCEELGRHCAATAICFGMHCVGSAVIAARPTEDQQRRYLEPIARGEHLTTLALSEPGTGVHFYLPETQLTPGGAEDFVVSGRKTFVTNGGHADSYVVSVVTPGPADGLPVGDFSCVVIDAAAEGMTWGEPWRGLGMRGNDSRTMELDGVRLPAGNLLGREGDELWYVFNVVAPYFLMAMAGTYLGVAAAALDEACEHLKGRGYSRTGRTLAQQSVLQHRVGALWSRLEATRRLVRHAATRADLGDEDALPAVLSAKAEVAECAVLVTNEALTLTGGIAYRENASLSRHLRDARAAHVMAPTTDILRTWAGRALLGQPLLSD